MKTQHPNLDLLSKLDITDLDKSAPLFSSQFVWHYFNPNLPEIEGDYSGVEGLKTFFLKVAEATRGTFRVKPLNAIPIGDELVVIHARDKLELDAKQIALDVAVVWRIVDGQFAEAWDIPSAYSLAI